MFLGGVLGAIAGGFINSAFANDSANRQADRNQALMEKQNEMNVENYKNRYQWQVEDMRKAGLNPILSSNLGAGSVGSAGLAGVSMPSSGGGAGDVGASINTALARDLTRKSVAIEQQNANTAEYRAETERVGVENEAKNLESQVKFRDTQIQLMSDMQAFEMDLKKQSFDRDTKIAFQRLDAEIEHWKRQDMNGAAMAGAAFASAAAQQALAATAEANGIAERDLKEAQRILTQQEGLTEHERTIREAWRNSDMYRTSESATGLISSILSVASMASGVRHQLDID